MPHIKSALYLLDVGGVSSSLALHELLSRTFAFPSYYGKNWDAFDECIGELALPAEIVLSGVEILKKSLPHDAHMLIDCLNYAKSEAPDGELEINVV
jgi:ribonuclease inhibitor